MRNYCVFVEGRALHRSVRGEASLHVCVQEGSLHLCVREQLVSRAIQVKRERY